MGTSNGVVKAIPFFWSLKKALVAIRFLFDLHFLKKKPCSVKENLAIMRPFVSTALSSFFFGFSLPRLST